MTTIRDRTGNSRFPEEALQNIFMIEGDGMMDLRHEVLTKR
jgi:hypothetical protein